MQVIEMDHMILHVLDTDDDIADQLGIGGHLDVQGIFHRPDRGDGMDGRTDPAEALGEVPGVAGITPLQDRLNAPEHGAAAPGILDQPAVDLCLYTEMSLYSCDRVY